MRLIALFIGVSLLVESAPHAQARATADDVRRALTELIETGQRPDETTPAWRNVRGALLELTAADPNGALTRLAHTAAARVDVQLPLMIDLGHPMRTELSAAPAFELPGLPRYVGFVEYSMDGGAWRPLGWATYPGVACGERLSTIFAQSDLRVGVHHIETRAEIFFIDALGVGTDEKLPPCGFARPLRVTRDTVLASIQGVIIRREQRRLASLKFGAHARSPAEIDAKTLVDDEPERLAGAAVAAIRNSPASRFDASLPATPVDVWLDVVLTAARTVDGEPAWGISDCQPDLAARHVVPRRALCVSVLAPLTHERFVELEFAVGAIVRGEGSATWQPEEPRLARGSIVNNEEDNALTVSRLSELAEKLALGNRAWPAIDLVLEPDSLAARVSELRAGAPVTLRLRVTNRGERDAPRANVRLELIACPLGESRTTAAFVPSVPAKGTADVIWTTRLPPGVAWMAIADVELETGRAHVGQAPIGQPNNMTKLALGPCLEP